jgi:hypothetical protein
MGARAEAIAKKFEAKVKEAAKVLDKISDADWKKVTAAEKWPVGVVAHHLAQAHAGLGGIVKHVATGGAPTGMTMDDIHRMNAQHAKDFADVTKAETLELHRKNAAAAAAIVRGLSDQELDRSGNVLGDMPAMTAEQLATGLLCAHVDEHLGSIRATIGN